MTSDEFNFDGKQLFLKNAKIAEFAVSIKDVVVFTDLLVVLLEQEIDENVFGVNPADGKIVWRIPKEEFPHKVNSYVNMWREGDNLGLGNSTGYTITADPQTGEILKKEFTK
jgi:hypothetical protein